jgi:hypothetical protein
MGKILSNKYLHTFDFLWRLFAPVIGLIIWSTYLTHEKYIEIFVTYWIGLILFQFIVFVGYKSPKKTIWTIINIVASPLILVIGTVIYGVDKKTLFLGFGVIEIIIVFMISFLFLITIVNTRLYAKSQREKKAHKIVNVIKLIFFGGIFLIILYVVFIDLVEVQGQFLVFLMMASIYSAVMYYQSLSKISIKNIKLKKILILLGITTIIFWIILPIFV